MGREIAVTINGRMERIADGSTIAELITRFEEQDLHLIVELNGAFVYSQQYPTTVASEGDRIEFVHPEFGG